MSTHRFFFRIMFFYTPRSSIFGRDQFFFFFFFYTCLSFFKAKGMRSGQGRGFFEHRFWSGAPVSCWVGRMSFGRFLLVEFFFWVAIN